MKTFVKLLSKRVVFLNGNKYRCIITHNGTDGWILNKLILLVQQTTKQNLTKFLINDKTLLKNKNKIFRHKIPNFKLLF